MEQEPPGIWAKLCSIPCTRSKSAPSIFMTWHTAPVDCNAQLTRPAMCPRFQQHLSAPCGLHTCIPIHHAQRSRALNRCSISQHTDSSEKRYWHLVVSDWIWIKNLTQGSSDFLLFFQDVSQWLCVCIKCLSVYNVQVCHYPASVFQMYLKSMFCTSNTQSRQLKLTAV